MMVREQCRVKSENRRVERLKVGKRNKALLALIEQIEELANAPLAVRNGNQRIEIQELTQLVDVQEAVLVHIELVKAQADQILNVLLGLEQQQMDEITQQHLSVLPASPAAPAAVVVQIVKQILDLALQAVLRRAQNILRNKLGELLQRQRARVNRRTVDKIDQRREQIVVRIRRRRILGQRQRMRALKERDPKRRHGHRIQIVLHQIDAEHIENLLDLALVEIFVRQQLAQRAIQLVVELDHTIVGRVNVRNHLVVVHNRPAKHRIRLNNPRISQHRIRRRNLVRVRRAICRPQMPRMRQILLERARGRQPLLLLELHQLRVAQLRRRNPQSLERRGGVGRRQSLAHRAPAVGMDGLERVLGRRLGAAPVCVLGRKVRVHRDGIRVCGRVASRIAVLVRLPVFVCVHICRHKVHPNIHRVGHNKRTRIDLRVARKSLAHLPRGPVQRQRTVVAGNRPHIRRLRLAAPPKPKPLRPVRIHPVVLGIRVEIPRRRSVLLVVVACVDHVHQSRVWRLL
eukprot:comp21398_c0_seq1/m.46208 comp21398_c0_seq1/g.46208  ORF comp21398_c0_seq1/g.46208 comp21398_c0_seq1/m.46208 type:complete len:516 (+) comp21398_c0_seq1:338-1885(+)